MLGPNKLAGSDPRLAQLQADFSRATLGLTKRELKSLGAADAELLGNVDLASCSVEARYCKSTAGQECTLRITIRDRQGRNLGPSSGLARRLVAEVCGPAGGSVPVRLQDAGAAGMCTASFAPTKADIYEVSVSFLGRPLPGTPFPWVVNAGAPSAFTFPERGQEARAGVPFVVRVRGVDVHGNTCTKGGDGDALRVEIVPLSPQAEGGPPQRGAPMRMTTVVMSASQAGVPSPTAESLWIRDLGDGSYDVHGLLFARGLYELATRCREKPCAVPPLRLVLRAGAILPEACTFEPEAEMFVAGQSLELFVRMMDGHDNVFDAGERPEDVTVTATIVGPDGRDVHPDVQWADEAHVSIAFFPVLAGQYTVTASVNGIPIKDSPVACFVYATAIFDRNCTVEIADGIASRTAGEPFDVLVALRDRYGNSRAGWRDPLTVYVTGSLVAGNEIQIQDDDTGVQRVTFLTERAGRYVLHVIVSDILKLTGTGLEIAVLPGPLDLARSELRCSFKGSSIVAGAPVSLSVVCRDCFGNPRTEGDDRPLLLFACWRNDDPFEFPPFNPAGNGEYKAEPPRRAGKYILSVATAGGAELPGSPARWEVLTGAISSKELVLRSGGTADHRIPLVDPFGNALVTPEQLKDLKVDAYGPGLVWPELQAAAPGSVGPAGHHLDLVLRPRALVPGPYVLRISLNDEELPASPFEFRVEPDAQGGRVMAAVIVDEALVIAQSGAEVDPGGAAGDKRGRRRDNNQQHPFSGQPPLDHALLTVSVYRPTPLRTTLVLLAAENSAFVEGAWPVLQRALVEGLHILQSPGCGHVRASAVVFADKATALEGPAHESLGKEIKTGRPICCLHSCFEALCDALNGLRRKFARDLRPGEWDLHVILALTGQHSCKETWHVDPADAFSEFRGLTRSAGPARVVGHCLAVGEAPDYGWAVRFRELLGLEPGAMLCPPALPGPVADGFARLLTAVALGTGGYQVAVELPSLNASGAARAESLAVGSADGANFLRTTTTVGEVPPLGSGGLESRGLVKVLAPTIAGAPNAVLEQTVSVERVVIRNQYVRQTALRGLLLEARARGALRDIAVAVMRADVSAESLRRHQALCIALYKAHGEIDWRPRPPVGAWCMQLLERMRALLDGVAGTGSGAATQETAKAARELRREATEVVHGQLLDSGGLITALVASAARKGPPPPKENRRGSTHGPGPGGRRAGLTFAAGAGGL